MSRMPEQIVRDFGALWEARDIDGIIDAVTDDVVYQNIPIPEMIGREAMRTFITPNLRRASGVEFHFRHLAVCADGATVLCERTDAFIFGDKRVAFPLMGIFELRGDRIAAWRDYADIPGFIRDMKAVGQAPGPGIVG